MGIRGEKQMKKQKEIISLHNQLVGERTAFPFAKSRDEYLRGWERALRWVMNQEKAPILKTGRGSINV